MAVVQRARWTMGTISPGVAWNGAKSVPALKIYRLNEKSRMDGDLERRRGLATVRACREKQQWVGGRQREMQHFRVIWKL